MNNQPIESAREALRSDSYADFAQQTSYLRQWLENLPVLPVEMLVQQKRAVARAKQGRLDEIISFIEAKWLAHNPPNSHEGAISADFGDESDLLTVTFHAYVWGMTSKQGNLAVARIGSNAYLFWSSF